MTLTPLLTLNHRRQVKDNFIILQKLSTQAFSVAIQATDNVQNFLKHIQKAYFQTVRDMSLISVSTILSQENPSRKWQC
jgi:hypothetical protein